MLIALSDQIIQDRPVLAIAMYHKKEDIIDIGVYLKNLLKDYIFILRAYPSWIGNMNQNHELILYAIPYERKSIV